jgi:hypothetical protein
MVRVEKRHQGQKRRKLVFLLQGMAKEKKLVLWRGDKNEFWKNNISRCKGNRWFNC